MESPDIRIGTLRQVSHAKQAKIHNQNHIVGQKQVDKTTLLFTSKCSVLNKIYIVGNPATRDLSVS